MGVVNVVIEKCMAVNAMHRCYLSQNKFLFPVKRQSGENHMLVKSFGKVVPIGK